MSRQLRNIIIFVVFIGLSFSDSKIVSANSEITIEDKELHRLSDEVIQNLCRQTDCNTEFKSCSFKGKQIDTPLSPYNQLYFITTENACGWGAYLGPIWLLNPNTSKNLLLETRGYGLEFEVNNNKQTIIIKYGSAGHASVEIWELEDQKLQRNETLTSIFNADCNKQTAIQKNNPYNPFEC